MAGWSFIDYGCFSKADWGLNGEVLSDLRFLPFSRNPKRRLVADHCSKQEAGWQSSASSGLCRYNTLLFVVSSDSLVLRLNRMVITR